MSHTPSRNWGEDLDRWNTLFSLLYDQWRSVVDVAQGVRVDGVIALAALDPVDFDEPVILQYHTTSGDGGYGPFAPTSGAIPGTYVGNGGTIILPSGGDGSSAWIRIFDGDLSIAMFGAIGDGTTSAQTAVVAAVAAAAALGARLYAPAGEYLTTDTVPGLHSVGWVGPGRIKRGSAIFAVAPDEDSANTLYCSPVGTVGNDGLSASEPAASFQALFDYSENYGPTLEGQWTFESAAGGYAGAADGASNNQTFSTPCRLPVIIKGPTVAHPSVPTCLFDGSALSSGDGHGLRIFGQNCGAHVQYIKFHDYDGTVGGTGNNGGLVAEYGARLDTTNVHCENCDWFGIYNFEGGPCRIRGGIFTTCRSGVITNSSAGTTTVGQGGSAGADRPQFDSCYQHAVYVSRVSTCHVDYCDMFDGARGVVVDQNSRAHIVGCDFARNNIGVQCDAGGVFFENGNTYNEGTGDANTTKWLLHAYCGEFEEFLNESVSEMRIGYDGTLYEHTGTVAKTSIASAVWTIPAYWFEDSSKKIRVEVAGQMPNRAGTKVGVDFGATEMDLATVVGTPAASAGFKYTCEVWANATANQRAASELRFSAGSPRIQTAAKTADTTVDLAIDITGELADAGDTLTIRRIEIWITG